MAQDPPSSIDVTDIQFKVHDKFTVFNPGEQLRSSVSLLATASNYGVMFVANPYEAEFKVILIKDLVYSKASGKGLHARQVQLPNLPNCIAVSCDGSMLAVNYTQNGCGFVAIYSVPSFTTANIKLLHNIRLPGDDNVSALQLLWNPVISGSLAVVMSNGALGMYEFKNNSYEFHTLDSKEQIKCGSWSPKGKQIVLGFPNGKLSQYKPDLKLAKTIACPPNIHSGPFDTISVQWLSTFQFAVVFLQQGEEATPSLYIVHAPKAGGPTYTNYYDICYSGTGPRAQQVNLVHIQPWNLLLVTSANGVEVGILGTKEATEAATWVQYTLLDEARIEMPLTEEKDETYPIGFALDTSSTHQLVVAEKKLPVMPMIHVLSTHGQLVAFNFLNLQPNTPDICSPPPPPSDTSGISQFKPVSEMLQQKKSELMIPAATVAWPAVDISAPPELSFASVPTPAPVLEKPKAIFGMPAVQTSAGSNMFGSAGSGFSFTQSAAAPVAAQPSTLFKTPAPAPAKPIPTTVAFGDIKKPPEQAITSTNASIPVNPDKSKPLYTVPPTYTPPAVVKPTPTIQQQEQIPAINANEVDDIVNEMISFQINSFDLELKKLGYQTKGLLNNIGSIDEMKGSTKRLNGLQEIVDQANEREFESDLQGLRNLLNESYTMLAECRSKLNMYNNPDIAKLASASHSNHINRRQLAKLNSLLANNKAQLQIIHNQIDAQWSNFQDLVRRTSRTQMHTPFLEGVYQRMTRLKDSIARERTKLCYIKSKLKEKGLLHNNLQSLSKPEPTIESLTDTILSMSLGPQVEENRSRLTKEKLNTIRELLRNRKISIIKPQRPDRVGLNSEVILETKLRSERRVRDGATTNMDKMEQERIKTEQQRVLTKPTATKALPPSMVPLSQPNAPATFGFGGLSSFVKPSPAKPEDFKKDQPQQQPAIVKPVASTAGPMFLKATAPSTTATISTSTAFSGFGAPPNANAAFAGFSITPSPMPAFTGFGTNSPLTFGAPKATVTQKDSVLVESAPKEPTAPLSFASKPIASDAKPFTTNFSSSFTVVAPSKPTESVEKENKLPENKPFIPVGTKSENIAAVSSSSSTLSFGSINASSTTTSGFSFSVSESAQAKTTTAASAPFTFSFASSLSSAGDTTTAVSKPLFSGFAKPTITSSLPITTATAPALEPVLPPPAIKTDTVPEVAVVESKPDSPEASSDSTGFTFSSLNLGTLGLPATPNLSPTPSVSTIDSGSPSSAATVKTTSASVSDPTDSVFGNLNICKPTSTENAGAFKSSFAPANLFGAASFGTDSNPDIKSIFGATITSKESTDTGPAAVSSTTADTGKSVFETSSTDTTASVSTTSTIITSAPSIFAPKATQSFTFGTPSIATTSSSIITGQVAATTSAPPSLFATPATGASIFASAAAATTTPASTTTLAGGPLFGGTGISFGTPTSQAPPPIFGAGATIPSATQATAVSPFAPVASTPATLFGTPTTTSTSIFGSAATATTPAVSSTTGNIFGGIPKPDQLVFGQTESNVFGAPNTDKSISGGNFFGGQGSAFGSQSAANTTGSIFGGSSPGTAQISSPFAANSNSGTNIFSSPTSGAGTNVFASPTQSAASGGSIFDQSAGTVQSGGSIFGGGATQPSFGTSNSPFAGNAASGGSIFGGSSTSPKPSVFGSPTTAPSVFGSTGTSGFGLFSQTPAFGSPTQPVANTGGSFAQGGSSITQQGFGSPGATAFTKPVFGGEPTFGSAPTFGSPPSFGSAPSFGSPKGFGSFAAPAASGGAFTSPTQKNNLFEALGSSDTGLSFGNLAQNTNTNQQKPAFGGSSFMSYRS